MEYESAVIGHKGEVGSAIYALAHGAGTVLGIEWDEGEKCADARCRFMHVCIPCGFGDEFVRTVASYAERLRPQYVIVHSTVPPGTCDRLLTVILQMTPSDQAPIVAHSPVRGVHPHLRSGILHYVKYVGLAGNAPLPKVAAAISAHLKDGLGCREVRFLSSARTCEVAKLLCTTYYGGVIALHQAFERSCKAFGVPFDEAVAEFNSTYFLGRDLTSPRPRVWPGVIGGHCVMPNVELLLACGVEEPMYRAIKASNELKRTEVG